jgi:7-cyano-7-deazaguanine synthase
MLSVALGWAEALGGLDIFFGANAVDYSGYPDCRPDYVESFEAMANLATKVGVESHEDLTRFRVHAPIIRMSKAEIVKTGMSLGVDFSQTVSCYQANSQGLACGQCESCRLRKEGFAAAGVVDPTQYA